MKKILLKFYYWGNLPKSKIETNQAKIRNVEWDAIVNYIPKGAKFLDVGCGAGFALTKAAKDKDCDVYGIDPEPGAHGVGRYSDLNKELNIKQGFAEKLPFDDNEFDVVYSSHVLEHVNDEEKSLFEMQRVLKDDGTLIIGMPTSNMAWLNLLSQMLFTTHQRVINFILSPIKSINLGKIKFINVFIPISHSYPRAETVCYDIKHYKSRNWRKTIEKYFQVIAVVKPAFYPYPEYLQLFKMKINFRFSSSVFFICKKIL